MLCICFSFWLKHVNYVDGFVSIHKTKLKVSKWMWWIIVNRKTSKFGLEKRSCVKQLKIQSVWWTLRFIKYTLSHSYYIFNSQATSATKKDMNVNISFVKIHFDQSSATRVYLSINCLAYVKLHLWVVLRMLKVDTHACDIKICIGVGIGDAIILN